DTGCQVLKLPKSGGVVTREREERRNARDARLKDYFYGPRGTLMPSTQQLRADQVLVFRVGGGPRAPNSALPIGAVSATDPLRVSHVAGSAELVQSVMAVSHAPTPEQALSSNVAGFVLVKDVDVARGTITVLSPAPGPLPNKYLVTGSLRSAGLV
ncbi:Pre-mRNA cleavage complex II Clp1, partial [Dunaliella salina]